MAHRRLDRPLQVGARALKVAAVHPQFAERVEDHRGGRGVLVNLHGEFERAAECRVRAVPLADEHEGDAEVVEAAGGVVLVLGRLVVGDGLLQRADAVVRALEEPVLPGDVVVNLAEHVGRGAVADELDGLLEVFERALVLPLVRVGDGEAHVALGQAAPVARAPVVFQRLVGVVAGDRVLADRAVDARQGRVDVAELRVRAAALFGRAQLGVEDGDGLRVVARVVVGQPHLHAHAGVSLGVERPAGVRRLVHPHGLERVAVAPLDFERDRKEAARARQKRRVAPRRRDDLAQARLGGARQAAV